ncbi:MAG: redoxin domain-containing protein [Proteobacteria bacterium]|nr:redoxin domain-containing protein [Pseudomonadota bacterium]
MRYLLLLLLSLPALAVDIGKLAPAFSLPSASGKTITSTQFKDKVVVLEWLNHGCPFVRKHYDSNNMQALQKKYKSQGVVWLSIISSAPGKQGHVTAKAAADEAKKYNSEASEILIDEDGTVGRAFEAKVTPHMYVIGKDGRIFYQGAIDSIASADIDDVAKAENYVAQALDATIKGEKIKIASTKAYGCGVKY